MLASQCGFSSELVRGQLVGRVGAMETSAGGSL